MDWKKHTRNLSISICLTVPTIFIVWTQFGEQALALSAAVALAGLLFVIPLCRARSDEIEVKARLLASELRFDSITGVLARNFFLAELHRVTACLRNPRLLKVSFFSVILLDLDDFKTLNDSMGHKVGDQALFDFAERLRAVFPRSVIGRLGGDEFAVILENSTEAETVRLTNELFRSLEKPMRVAGKEIRLGASVGIAIAPQHFRLEEELLVLADLALYESKRLGRGRATVFYEKLLTGDRHLRSIERDLQLAIDSNSLAVHYQPLTDADGCCIGVEALSRWHHETFGSIPPSSFVAVAERSTLIDKLGEWVLDRVCRDLPNLPGGYVAFNVSGAQLQRPAFIEMVRQVINRTGANPRRLVAEITEGVALMANETTLGNLQALRSLGIRIALDDFGTGHCSFQTLRSLPVDAIKLDRSYISSLGTDPVSQIFVTAVCQTARALGLSVVAEGVENENEAVLAKSAGCSLFQGYLYRKPGSIEELSDWLAGNRLASDDGDEFARAPKEPTLVRHGSRKARTERAPEGLPFLESIAPEVSHVLQTGSRRTVRSFLARPEYRSRSLVRERLGGCLGMTERPFVDGWQREGSAPDPIGRRRAIEMNALRG